VPSEVAPQTPFVSYYWLLSHLVVRHDDHAVVALGSAKRRQAYPRAPGRAFHHGTPLLQLPGSLGLLDHACGDTVLACAARVKVLYLLECLKKKCGEREQRAAAAAAAAAAAEVPTETIGGARMARVGGTGSIFPGPAVGVAERYVVNSCRTVVRPG